MSVTGETSNFDELLAGKRPYVWGQVEKVINADKYGVVVYRRWVSDDGRVRRGTVDEAAPLSYHPYFRGKETGKWKDTHMSFSTLEGALAHAMAERWEGLNSQASHYFVRMIGAVPEPADNAND